MTKEIKETLDELGSAFAKFKAANEERLAAVEKRGAAGVELEAKVDKINASVTEFSEKLATLRKQHEDAATDIERMRQFATQAKVDEKIEHQRRVGMRAFLAKARGTKIDQVQLTDADVDAIKQYSEVNFLAYLRRGGHNGDALHPDIRAGMSIGSDPEGGYLVPPDMTGRIAQLVYESSPMRQIADVTSTNSDRKTGRNDLDQAEFGWVGETASRSVTDHPELGKWEIPVREAYASPKTSQSEIDDSIIDLGAWLEEKMSNRISRGEATSFYTGDGVAKPRGFLTYADGVPSASTWNVIEQTDTGVNGGFHATLPGDVFHTVIGLLKQPYLAGAVWQMNRTTLAATRKIKDGDGTYLWEKSFQAGQPFMLLGFPVTLAEDMPAIATGSLSIAFGNFREGYTIVDRKTLSVLRDNLTDKPNIIFYGTVRVGGDVTNFEAIKLINFQA